MISVPKSYVVAQKQHIEGTTYSSLLNLNSASKKLKTKSEFKKLKERKKHTLKVCIK